MKTHERIESAIRHRTAEGLTLVRTETGRFLLVRGYRAEYERAKSEPGMAHISPQLDNVEILGDSTEAEFYWHCAE